MQIHASLGTTTNFKSENMFKGLYNRKKVETDNDLIEQDFNKKNPIADNYITIDLPKLRFVKQCKPSDRIPSRYYEIVDKGRSHYNRKWYEKAKDEFLKAYNFNYKADSYFTHLIRAYRKTIERFIEKKKYLNAIEMFEEMFDKCPNYTITDIKKFNKIVKFWNSTGKGENVELKELIVNEVEEFKVNSDRVTFLTECKKPRGFKISKTANTTYSDLTKLSEFILQEISYISFQNGKLEYKQAIREKEIFCSPYRFKETSDSKHFITSTTDLEVLLFNWQLEKIKSFNAAKYSSSYTNLRCIDLSLDLSLFLVTNIDKAYLLDSNFKDITTWEAPHKDGFEKRKVENNNTVNSGIENSLRTLELSGKPNQDEIKKSFRKLLLKHHPDRNQDNPTAQEKTRELIQAYELLTGEDAQNAFNGVDKSEYYWVDTKNITKFEAYGFSFEMSFSLGNGEDWIYGTGISDDGQRVYLGCYSGKIYQINKLGNLQKKYVIPEDKTGLYGSTNPISSIKEFKGMLYILSSWYVYILKADQVIKYIPVNDSYLKWFEEGFILLDKKEFKIYDLKGGEIGKISFKQNINQVSYVDKHFIVSTVSKTYCFNWSKNAP